MFICKLNHLWIVWWIVYTQNNTLIDCHFGLLPRGYWRFYGVTLGQHRVNESTMDSSQSIRGSSYTRLCKFALRQMSSWLHGWFLLNLILSELSY